jgi:ABC-2 type transport system ATP-binding protein
LKVGAPQSLFDEAPVFAVRVSPVTKELLHRLGSIALSVKQDADEPCLLYVELQKDEQAAEIAEVVHACGSLLYGLTPHHRSLEQLFLRTIDASRHPAPAGSSQS